MVYYYSSSTRQQYFCHKYWNSFGSDAKKVEEHQKRPSGLFSGRPRCGCAGEADLWPLESWSCALRNVPWPGTGSGRAYVTATQNRSQKKLHKRHNLRLRRPSVPDRVMMAYYLVATLGAEKWIYLRCGKYSYSWTRTFMINSQKEGFIRYDDWMSFLSFPSYPP